MGSFTDNVLMLSVVGCLYEFEATDRGASTVDTYFPTILGDRDPRSKCQPIWLLVRILFLAWRKLLPWCVLTWWRCVEVVCGKVLFLQGHEFHYEGPLSCPHSNLNYFPKAPSPKTFSLTLGARPSTYKFGGQPISYQPALITFLLE